jgi:hypothetical protein
MPASFEPIILDDPIGIRRRFHNEPPTERTVIGKQLSP